MSKLEPTFYEVIDEELDTLWEIALALAEGLKEGEYSREQYIEEQQEAMSEAKKKIIEARDEL